MVIGPLLVFPRPTFDTYCFAVAHAYNGKNTAYNTTPHTPSTPLGACVCVCACVCAASLSLSLLSLFHSLVTKNAGRHSHSHTYTHTRHSAPRARSGRDNLGHNVLKPRNTPHARSTASAREATATAPGR